MSNGGTIHNIEQCLEQLGAHGNLLSEEERKALDELGFVVFSNMVGEPWLQQLRAAYEGLMTKEGSAAGAEARQETGTRRLSDLVNKGEVFDGMYTHPKVLAAVYHILGREFKLSTLNGRDAIPGQGHQALHPDWAPRSQGEPYHVVNSVWMLDDFKADNGATRLVPGSHLLEGSPANYMADAGADHPNQVLLLAPAGSVAVFNSHVWHGGTINRSDRTRRALFAYYCERKHVQMVDQKTYIRMQTYNRISDAAKYILDV